jgi:hypothetical protein
MLLLQATHTHTHEALVAGSCCRRDTHTHEALVAGSCCRRDTHTHTRLLLQALVAGETHTHTTHTQTHEALVAGDYSCPCSLFFFTSVSSLFFHRTIFSGFVEHLVALAHTLACYHLSFPQTLVMPLAVSRRLQQQPQVKHP